MMRHLLQAEKGRGEKNNAEVGGTFKSMRAGGEFFKPTKECYQQP
jgi:hypothetical protein